LAAWKTIFLITAGLQTFSIGIFVIFGRTSVQPWNTYWKDSSDSKSKEEMESKKDYGVKIS
jgi:hypothetical protein